MSVPRDRAICRIRPQAYPFITRRAEDTIWFELGDVRVRAEIFNAFLFGALSATSLGLWRGRVRLLNLSGGDGGRFRGELRLDLRPRGLAGRNDQ